MREDRLLTESHLVVLEVLLVADDSSPRACQPALWDWDKVLLDAGLLKGGERVLVRETMDSIDMSEVLRQRDAAKAETRRLIEGEPSGELEKAVEMLCNEASTRGVKVVMGPDLTLTPDDIRRAVGILASSRQLALEKRDAALEDAAWHRKRCEELREQVRVQSDESLRLKLEKREDWKAACESATGASNLVGTLKARVAELEAAAAAEDDAANWRLLEVGEVAKVGDEQSVNGKWCALVNGGYIIKESYFPHRRRRAPSIQSRDLPEQVSLLWASVTDILGRVVRLEGEMDAGQEAEEAATAVCDPPSPADGLRTERVTLEITHNLDAPLGGWVACAIDETLRGVESVRVVEETEAMRVMTKLRRERDDAIRERDFAREEAERLRVSLAACAVIAESNTPQSLDINRQVRPKYDCAAVQAVIAAVEREIALRDRVAELEAAAKTTALLAEMRESEWRVASELAAEANAENAGGEAKQEPVAWGVMSSANPPHRIGLHWDQETAHRWAAAKQDVQFKTTLVVVPLYAAPPEPRGWLTAEERQAVGQCLRRFVRQEVGFLERNDPSHRWLPVWRRAEATLVSLLARESPPLVKVPHRNVITTTAVARDIMWIDAIRAAGGEVEGEVENE